MRSASMAELRAEVARCEARELELKAELLHPRHGEAVIAIRVWRDSPELFMSATCEGRFDSRYAALEEGRLVEVEIPKLLAELRAQLQRSSGSTVTE